MRRQAASYRAIAEMAADQKQPKSGADALKRMAQDDPTSFVRVVAGVLPKEIDASVTVTVEQFQRAETYLQAFRLARDFIGAEDKPLLIEAHDE